MNGSASPSCSIRRLATGLLFFMVCVFVAARLLEPGYPAFGFVRAFAEAALVGGLADWFAVTALFRRPLGLPIPHTALIPANRDRLADGVASFLKQNFLTRPVLAQELARLDFAKMIAGLIADDVRRRRIAAYAADLAAGQFRSGQLLAHWLSAQLDQQRELQWFDRIVAWSRRTLQQHHADVYQKVSEKSPRWMPRRINDEFYLRLMDGLEELLDEMLAPDSAARQQFAQALHQLAARLDAGHDEDNESDRTADEGSERDSPLLQRIDAALGSLARRLDADAALRSALNRRLQRLAAVMLARQREAVAGVVRRVIASWDAQTLALRVEAQVGRDLQFIRINGTLAGGLVGLALHIISITF